MSNRYDLIGYCSYRDNETGMVSDNFVGVLNEQDKKIKELEHRMAKCIEPKFKIGQEVWIVFDRTLFGERLKTVEKTKIFGINVTDFIDYYFQTLPCIAREEEIFATEEEAKAKLRSLQDGN